MNVKLKRKTTAGELIDIGIKTVAPNTWSRRRVCSASCPTLLFNKSSYFYSSWTLLNFSFSTMAPINFPFHVQAFKCPLQVWHKYLHVPARHVCACLSVCVHALSYVCACAPVRACVFICWVLLEISEASPMGIRGVLSGEKGWKFPPCLIANNFFFILVISGCHGYLRWTP